MNKNESTLKRLFNYGGNYKYLTMLGMVLSGISAVLSIMPILFIWKGVALVLRNYGVLFTSETIKTSLFYYSKMTIITAIAAMLIYFIALMFTHVSAFKIAKNMRTAGINHMMKLPLGYFDETGSGKIRRVIDESAASTESYLAHQLPDLVGAFVGPIAILILFVTVDIKFGLISIIPLVLAWVSLKSMTGKGEERVREYQNSLENMNNEAIEYIRGIPIIKTFNQSVFSFENFHKSIMDYKENVLGFTFKMKTPMTMFQVFLNSIPIFIVLGGIILSKGADNKVEFLVAFVFYLFVTPICNTMMKKIMWTSQDSILAKDGLDRMDSLLSEKTLAYTNKYDKIERHDIEFKDVYFKYPKANKYAVEGLSFKVKENTTVALVGASGSGKSTIATLISRFWDVESGSIKIGGLDIRDIKEETLMENISFVFQNTNLYKKSILDNVKEGNPNASLDQVMKALEAAQCMEIIEKFPDGVNTMIGSEGVYLSGGEAQRISLARGILKDAPIILLDEATAFTDPENEHKIQLAFESITKNKTVIMIAHRLSTVQDADEIFVIDKGNILESGRHEELLEKDGKYASMWKEYQTAFVWNDGEVKDHE